MDFIDHIGVFDNRLSVEDCNEYISFFEDVVQEESAWFTKEGFMDISMPTSDGECQFSQKHHGRQDISIFLNFIDPRLSSLCNEILQECFDEYSDYYQELKNYNLYSRVIKMQRTPPGGGYHVWHCENLDFDYSPRQVAWMIYLNDMPDGEAETEFLYQKTRLKPKAGTVVLWPAAYTHVHRGNTVFTQNKYILTGWFLTMPQ